jgi:hypothetical protein
MVVSTRIWPYSLFGSGGIRSIFAFLESAICRSACSSFSRSICTSSFSFSGCCWCCCICCCCSSSSSGIDCCRCMSNLRSVVMHRLSLNLRCLLLSRQTLPKQATTLPDMSGKNGKVAHNRAGTAVQTSNGTAVHAKGSSTVRSTNGAYHASGTNGAAVHTNTTTAVHTNSTSAVHTNANWDDAYWHSNKYGYWNGQRGYWHVVSGQHVFVVVN